MSDPKKKQKIRKGDYGYFRAEKKKQLLITFLLFAVPLGIFFSAWAYHGSRLTIWTVISVVGCLPACKALVNLIMILRCRPLDESLYRKSENVVCYSSDPKIDAAFMGEQAQKIVRKNGYKVTLKVFTDLKPFLERLDSMNEHRESLEADIKFTPDERYPEFSRNEMIRHTLLALCL